MTGNQLKTPNLLKSYLTYNIVQVKEGGSVVASTLKLNAIANVNYLNCNDTVENGVVHEIDALLEAPNTSAEAFRRLGLGDLFAITDIESVAVWGQLSAGNAIEVGDPLFPRLDVDELNFDAE